MAEPRFNRLKGNVDRIERSIATAKRSLKTNKKFAEGVDYSEELRAKSLRDYKLDQKELKTLQEDLKKAESELKDFVAEERSKKGQEEAEVIERKYARLEEALALQFDPTSDSAKKIKDDYEDQIIKTLQQNGMEKATIQIGGGQLNVIDKREPNQLSLTKIEELLHGYFRQKGGQDQTLDIMTFIRANRGYSMNKSLKQTGIQHTPQLQ
jgi:hypothetical protein